jgi:DNA topoisomerase IB
VAARLRRSDCSKPGITRVRRGRGFAYETPDGGRPDVATRERISALRIPPAWREVWICEDALGHLQATGVDDRGRKQYLYHPGWHERRARAKFEVMEAFARRLPSVRDDVARELEAGGLGRERVLACAVRLLDLGFFRVGGEGYAAENDSYGLATLRKEHVRVDGDVMLFDYVAKGGVRRRHTVRDAAAAEVVRALLRRRSGGEELLAHRAGRTWADIRSDDINAHLKALAGPEVSAKVFRTWQGTVLAAVALGVSAPAARTATARRRAKARAAQEVARYLGNTPTVARSSYVDPRVFDRFDGGLTIAGALGALTEQDDAGLPATHGAMEEAVLDLLARDVSSPHVERVRVAA